MTQNPKSPSVPEFDDDLLIAIVEHGSNGDTLPDPRLCRAHNRALHTLKVAFREFRDYAESMVRESEKLAHEANAIRATVDKLGTLEGAFRTFVDQITKRIDERFASQKTECGIIHAVVEEKIKALQVAGDDVDKQFEELDTSVKIKVYKDTEALLQEERSKLQTMTAEMDKLRTEKHEAERWFKRTWVQFLFALALALTTGAAGYAASHVHFVR